MLFLGACPLTLWFWFSIACPKALTWHVPSRVPLKTRRASLWPGRAGAHLGGGIHQPRALVAFHTAGQALLGCSAQGLPKLLDQIRCFLILCNNGPCFQMRETFLSGPFVSW